MPIDKGPKKLTATDYPHRYHNFFFTNVRDPEPQGAASVW
jgi:hypothetical protein